MKRTRSFKNTPKNEPESSRSRPPIHNSISNNERTGENITSSMHTQSGTTRTGNIIRGRQADLGVEKTANGNMENYPNMLSHMIASIVKEISKEAGGLANLSRSFVDNSINNGHMGPPHVNMDLEENESRLHQNPEYKQSELDDALEVIKKTMKLDAADPFNRPVDPEALGLPDYFDVVKTPMDFGTICNNIENGLKYMNSSDVFKDVEYIWNNCVTYNNKGDHILELMKRVKTFFMRYWKAAGLHMQQSPSIIEIPPRAESSISRQNKRQKDDSLSPPTNNFTPLQQKEAGFSNQLTEEEPVPINMQPGQPSQSSSQSQSTPEKEEHNNDTDSAYTPKKYKPRSLSKIFTTVGRVKVSTNELGQPVGQEASKLTSFLGHTARDGNLAPLTYPGWSKMPEENKENMWQKVLTRFDIDPSCRSWVLMSLECKWRNFRATLKANHYDTHATDEERLADCDQRVLPDQWASLVAHWSSDKFQNISAKNKANRAKVRFSHTSGTKSFARLLDEERAKRPDGKELSRAELFILTRTRKNGQPVNEETAAVISELRESEKQDDAFDRVVGEDRKGGVSLSGLHANSRTVVPSHAEGLKLVEEKNADIVEMKERLKSVEETCSQMAAQMSAMVEMMSNMQKRFLAQNVSNDVAVELVTVGVPSQSGAPSTSIYQVPAKKTRGRKKRW